VRFLHAPLYFFILCVVTEKLARTGKKLKKPTNAPAGFSPSRNCRLAGNPSVKKHAPS
jgi:hypothetical protein